MLKLTRHICEWSADAGAMDFYERGLFNHILPSQDPATGMVIYYCPLRPGAWKSYSTPDQSFWCCVGTGMENHTKYGDTISRGCAQRLVQLPAEGGQYRTNHARLRVSWQRGAPTRLRRTRR
jgi:DUF1680 family protein